MTSPMSNGARSTMRCGRWHNQGFLIQRVADASSWRVDYTITPEGDAEFLRRMRIALAQPEHRPHTFAAALAFFNALPRAEVVELLRERLTALQAQRDEKPRPSTTSNPHISVNSSDCGLPPQTAVSSGREV